MSFVHHVYIRCDRCRRSDSSTGATSAVLAEAIARTYGWKRLPPDGSRKAWHLCPGCWVRHRTEIRTTA